MSSLIVEISRIESISAHPNADALELAQIKGWQCCVPKGRHQVGELVTYIPIDAVLPLEHSDRWGITKYLSNGRVRCARLRGEPSFGVIIEREDPAWGEGLDVAAHYGITKYEPPFKADAGDSEPEHPLFARYTDIENLRNFPEILEAGEPVLATEKIHGTSCRVGCLEGTLVAGSKQLQRKRPEEEAAWATATYWSPLTLPAVRTLLETLGRDHRQVILFGEVFGKGVQSLHYGQKSIAFRAFDLLIDGKYLGVDGFRSVCAEYGVETVPSLYEGPFSLEAIVQVSVGNTVLGDEHIREGVVIRPLTERTDPKIGRVCFKYLSDDYLFGKGISDSTDR